MYCIHACSLLIVEVKEHAPAVRSTQDQHRDSALPRLPDASYAFRSSLMPDRTLGSTYFWRTTRSSRTRSFWRRLRVAAASVVARPMNSGIKSTHSPPGTARTACSMQDDDAGSRNKKQHDTAFYSCVPTHDLFKRTLSLEHSSFITPFFLKHTHKPPKISNACSFATTGGLC